MFQAITTKYLGPTDHRGSRVKAQAEAGSLTLDWDDNLNSDQNHVRAAQALARKLDWTGNWYGGAIPGVAYAWVLATDARDGRDCFSVTHLGD